MQTKSLLYLDKHLHYTTYGAGKPVILLHGFGEDSTIWQSQADALKNNYQLIVPDLPGSGQSEFIAGADIETYAEIVKAIIDKEISISDAEKIVLIGHSMGGYITLAFAEKYPQYLTAFGLFHSSAFADTADKKATRKKAIEFIKENGAYTFLKTSIPGLFTQQYKDQYPEKVEALIEQAKQFSPEALIQYYEAMIARPDRIAILKQFDGPVLFIMGEHDMAVPFESSLQQSYLPQQSHVHILRQSAHMGMWEEPQKANAILLDFLTAI